MRRCLSLLASFTILLLLTGCGQSAAEKEAAEPVTLKVWGVFEDEEAMETLMDAYRLKHKNVSFDFRILRYDEYEEEIIRAFAAGEGPDIFAIHNTWLNEYKDLITPLPKSLSIPYTETKGTIKKETITVLREEKTVTLQELKNNFLDVVYDDVVRSYQPDPKEEAEDKIFALPLYVDTLALYSNTDLLNSANIAEPPTTWQQFQDQVKRLTKVNAGGAIVQSAAAIGTAANVERASDILAVLMIQNGTVMESGDQAVFAAKSGDRMPAAEALRFYTDFANPVKEVYTWNTDMADSFETFANGQTAFFFGYAYHQPLLKAAAPKLKYKISTLPQIESGQSINFANYWLWTVSKATENSKWAWDFIQFAADKENVADYLSTSLRPTALRGLINDQLENEEINVFVSQLLTAKSWYHGNDAGVAEEAFGSMIDNAFSGAELENLVKEAQNKVNQTY
jgi:multiple sugar transport system substrate-binding protein